MVFLDFVPLGSKLPTMDHKALMQRLQTKLDQPTAKTAGDQAQRLAQAFLQMDMAELGEMIQSDGKHKGSKIKVAAQDLSYLLWLCNHQAENPKYQALMVYAQRQELAKPEVKGKQLPMDGYPKSCSGSASIEVKSTKSLTQLVENLTSMSELIENPNKMNETMEKNASIEQLQAEMISLSSLVQHLQDHSRQVQEAVMVLHQHLLGLKDEVSQITNRVTQIEVGSEEWFQPPEHQG